MKTVLSFLATILVGTSALAQYETEAVQIITQDYIHLLQSIADINAELSLSEHSEVKTELRIAKSALIADYISGPFGIFSSENTPIHISGAKTSVGTYLKKLTHVNSQNIDIFITDLESSNGVIHISFDLAGVAKNPLNLKSKIIRRGSDMYIASIMDQSKTSPTNHDQAKVLTHNTVVPEIITQLSIELDHQIMIRGSVKDHQSNGVLTMISESDNRQEVLIDANGTFGIAISQSPKATQEIRFRYQYGDKFLELRKNIIVTKDNRLVFDLQSSESSKDKLEAIEDRGLPSGLSSATLKHNRK